MTAESSREDRERAVRLFDRLEPFLVEEWQAVDREQWVETGRGLVPYAAELISREFTAARAEGLCAGVLVERARGVDEPLQLH